MKEISGIVFYSFNEVCISIDIDPASTQIKSLAEFECFYYIKGLFLFREYIPKQAFTDNVLVDGMVSKSAQSFSNLYDNNIRHEHIDMIPIFYEATEYIEINGFNYKNYLETLPKKLTGYFQLSNDYQFEKDSIFFHQDTVKNIFQIFGINEKKPPLIDSLKTRVDLAQKTRNSYLRTIKALAEALFDQGLTGNPYTDANKIMQKLSTKGISAPIGSRTMGDYLKEAKNIDSD